MRLRIVAILISLLSNSAMATCEREEHEVQEWSERYQTLAAVAGGLGTAGSFFTFATFGLSNLPMVLAAGAAENARRILDEKTSNLARCRQSVQDGLVREAEESEESIRLEARESEYRADFAQGQAEEQEFFEREKNTRLQVRLTAQNLAWETRREQIREESQTRLQNEVARIQEQDELDDESYHRALVEIQTSIQEQMNARLIQVDDSELRRATFERIENEIESEINQELQESRENFVRQCFRTHAGRDADAEGLTQYTEQVCQRGKKCAEDRIIEQGEKEEFLQGCYETFLGRRAELCDLKAWTEVICQVGRELVESGIRFSIEGRNFTVTQCYREKLGREPESSGLEYWACQIKDEKSEEQIRQGIAASDEAFVQGCYRNHLGRWAEVGGLQSWIAALPSLGRDGVEHSIHFSPEGRNHAVAQCYREFLRREPEPAGLAHWSDQIRDQGSLQSVRNCIMNSEEARNLQ